MSWELILPYLRPLEPFLQDPEVTDILINGPRVFVERSGVMAELSGVTIPAKALLVGIRNIARVLDDEINEEQPLLDARLPDGSRIAAVFPPVAPDGVSVAIRKFRKGHFTAAELVRLEMVPKAVLDYLAVAVSSRHSLLVSGPTGTGKTTFLTALSEFIEPQERIVLIEDTSEIKLMQANVVRLEARRAQPEVPAVTMRALLKMSLRLKPDRIVIGELRGEEAFEFLQALNTGQKGAISTTHANSARESLDRFATCVLMSDVRLGQETIARQIGLGLQVLVHLGVRNGERKVLEVVRLKGYDSRQGTYLTETIYAA